jgi:hypothetical protein
MRHAETHPQDRGEGSHYNEAAPQPYQRHGRLLALFARFISGRRYVVSALLRRFARGLGAIASHEGSDAANVT